MSLELSTAPATEPITLAEAKEHLIVEHSQDDTKITNLIKAAREWVEQVTWRALITQTWKLRLRAFPCGSILLPKPKLQSVSSVAYVDANGTAQTWSSSLWTTDVYSEPGLLYPIYDGSYPTIRVFPKSVTVTFVAGYGSATTDVPEGIRTVLMDLVSFWYESRGQESDKEIKEQLMGKLSPYLFRDERVLEFV